MEFSVSALLPFSLPEEKNEAEKTYRRWREPRVTTASPRPYSCPSIPSARPMSGSLRPTLSYHVAEIVYLLRVRTFPISSAV
jgi:hypothetical protein